MTVLSSKGSGQSVLGQATRDTSALLTNVSGTSENDANPEKLSGLQADLHSLHNLNTYSPDEASRLHEAVDFVVCLGGDGLVLHASSIFQSAIPPVQPRFQSKFRP